MTTTPLPTASPASVGFSPERLDRLDDAMQVEIDAGHYAGISLIVARHGQLVKFRRYGYQTLESRSPLREDAIFRIASMTKPIIGAAMMLLYEEGKWQLDDPVSKFIPELTNLQVLNDDQLVPPDRPMTMRHLMASAAGFAFGAPVGSTNPKVDEIYAAADLFGGTNDDMIAKLTKLPLEAQPGTLFRYGFQQEVQGAIIKRISGETLDAFLERRIFEPLGMKDTGFGVAPENRDRIAPRYTLDESLTLRLAADQSPFPVLAGVAAGEKPRYLLSIAGLYSTAQDYLRFAQMLATGGILGAARILAPTSVALMTSNLLPDGVPMRFDQPLGGRRLWHGRRHRARSGTRRFQRRHNRCGQLLLGRGARHLVLGGSDLRHHRHRHDPARKRRQSDDRAPLSGAGYPRDIAIPHLFGADQPGFLSSRPVLTAAINSRNVD
jgi:CubicO group peptidase (beta-lactamase class C family)